MAICGSDEADGRALRELLIAMPNLRNCEHELTSAPTREYNCIAYAAGDDEKWWWPPHPDDVDLDLSFWPAGVPADITLEAFSAAFATRGFSPCGDGGFAHGVEKIALFYNDHRTPTHAARQIFEGPYRGHWISKLGMLADIRHKELIAVECSEYGSNKRFFSRPTTSKPTD